MPKSNHKLNDITVFFAENRWPWHAAFWLLYIGGKIYSYYLTILYYSKEVLIWMLSAELILVCMVYFTLYLYKKLNRLSLILVSLPIWVIVIALMSYSQVYFLGSIPEFSEINWLTFFISNLEPLLLTYALLILSKYFKDSFISEWKDKQQQKTQLQSELRNLKAQVSPHFLFNTMNNFYGLAVEKSDKLPDLMVRLSDLLRYSLYETQTATVPLSREISYLENYIALEKIRLEDDLIFEFKNLTYEDRELHIAPLLLIILVENAFKHAKGMITAPTEIKIELTTDINNVLTFTVQNNCEAKKSGQNKEDRIGLMNLRKRLEVLYPESKHELITIHKGELFQATMKINLQSSLNE